ncbi:uncharacterized protein [Lolium perenne]|uniref:uncharacterized protein n=1 Tax=Lolium perenne TaxID=4522 RepID=UPI0021F5760D|nr:uncharacterized protein LOC127319694 [Lolium perenne]XP_051205621.1 uncharacterized protein LOC127319694 [Lolium perenne]XP_051205622.1 uncharacterized protein LOC127319694 [Lolium perenne]
MTSPAAGTRGRGRGRGRARGRGRGRGRGGGRGRSSKTPPPASPPSQGQEAALEDTADGYATGSAAVAAAVPETTEAAQGSIDQTVGEEPKQPSHTIVLSDDEIGEVEGGEARAMAAEDAVTAQDAQGRDREAVENEAAEVKEQDVDGGNADDVAAKDDVAAQSATDDASNKQESDPRPLFQEEMNAEQQEEEDPEEVIFEDPMDEALAAAEVKGEEEDHAMLEEDPEEVVFEDPLGGGQVKGEEDRARVEEDERTVMSNMAKNRQLKKELEIFVGGLGRDTVEEDIRKVFGQVGDVVEVRLHKDFLTNRNKGFAFVKFASKEQVARALAEMKNPMIHGKRCGVTASEDNDTLFLGNICNTWTKEAIKRRLSDYGVQGVESLTLVPDTQNEGKSRGFAFLEFSCHADAMLAFKRLQQPDALFGHPERTAKVAFAEPIKEPDAEVMAQVKSVFIDGLPPYWDEDRVKDRFKAYGLIERVVLARNMSSAKRNDFGFVNFSTHEAALACIEATNNTELGDEGKSKLKVRVRLSNPLPKSQAVKGGMSGGFRIGYPVSGFNKPGRGFNRGRSAPRRAGFHGGRGFNNHSLGRGGRFSSAPNNNSFEVSPSDFRGSQAPAFREDRWEPSSGRHGSFDRGYPPPRRPAFEPEGDFGGPFGENQYFYADARPSFKRPHSHMEPDPGYFEPGPPRVRPRFDHYDHPFPGGNRFDHYDQLPFSGRDRYRDPFEMGSAYPRDYYDPRPGRVPAAPDQYGRGAFRPHYRGGHSGFRGRHFGGCGHYY